MPFLAVLTSPDGDSGEAETEPPTTLEKVNYTLSNPPNPYPVPDSDVILLIGRPMCDAPPRKVILRMLISLLRAQYDTLLRRRRDPRIDPEGIKYDDNGVSMTLNPRVEDDVSAITGRVVTDAVLGMSQI